LFVFTVIFISRFKKVKRTVEILAPNKIQNIILNFSNKKNILKVILLIIGTFFIFFSLLSPQWNKKEEKVEQQSRDIFIALDISRSMLAQDFSPNRLKWAKLKIKKLLEKLSTDRIGLILFSGSAFVQCPLTHDMQTFFMFLDQADTEIISTGTTSIEQAIKVAVDKFATNGRKNKLLIIFTDGEDFSSDLAGIKKEAVKHGLNIFTIGAGTPQGAPIPLFDQNGKTIGHQLGENEKVVISKLNEGILKALSESCRGTFIKGTQNDNDLNELISKIKKFEKEKFDDKKMSYLEEQYSYFLIISFICFALEWIL
jgi:Ca-activated chloride channel family protein